MVLLSAERLLALPLQMDDRVWSFAATTMKDAHYFVKRMIQNNIVVRLRRFLRSWLLTFTLFLVFVFNYLLTLSRH